MILISILALLLIIVSAFLFIFGVTSLGTMLFITVLLLAAMSNYLPCLIPDITLSHMDSVAGYFFLVIAVITVLVAFKRFTDRKRAYKTWINGEEKTSLKRRLEND